MITDYKDGNWFATTRMMWIEETLHVYGYLRREHLERKFRISTPQASHDLKRFMQLRPGAMVYNTIAKRYETTARLTEAAE
jgi:hypothetical protein